MRVSDKSPHTERVLRLCRFDSALMSPASRRVRDYARAAQYFCVSGQLLTIEELSARLKLPKSTIYEMTRNRAGIRHAAMPHIKLGKRLRFNWRLVCEYITELEQNGGDR